MTLQRHSTEHFTVTVEGKTIGLSLEKECWVMVGEVAAAKGLSRAALIARIRQFGETGSLSSSIRIYLLRHYRKDAGLEPISKRG